MQFIRPNAAFLKIRLRFTPPGGWVYGSTPTPSTPTSRSTPTRCCCLFPSRDPPQAVLYDSERGTWNGKYKEMITTPWTPVARPLCRLWQGPYFNNYGDAQPARVLSGWCLRWHRHLELVDKNDTVQFTARVRFCAAPPFRAGSQIRAHGTGRCSTGLAGPRVDPDKASIDDTRHRAACLWNCPFRECCRAQWWYGQGRPNHADTMPTPCRPMTAPTTIGLCACDGPHSIDTLPSSDCTSNSTALSTGRPLVLRCPAPTAWNCRSPTDKGRRKMPALMSGLIPTTWPWPIARLTPFAMLDATTCLMRTRPQTDEGLTPRNLTRNWNTGGEPFQHHIASSVGNCCPGLVGLPQCMETRLRRYHPGGTWQLRARPKANAKTWLGHRLLSIEIPDEQGKVVVHPVVVQTIGPSADGSDVGPLGTDDNPDAVVNLEWSNTLAAIWAQWPLAHLPFHPWKMPNKVCACDDPETITRKLKSGTDFEAGTTVINEALAGPGELTLGCAPLAKRFRECVCYYWAASRPDYINVEPVPGGGSQGDNWMTRQRSGRYVVDDYRDSRLINYQDLFNHWEKVLKFQLGGRDVPEQWTANLSRYQCIGRPTPATGGSLHLPEGSRPRSPHLHLWPRNGEHRLLVVQEASCLMFPQPLLKRSTPRWQRTWKTDTRKTGDWSEPHDQWRPARGHAVHAFSLAVAQTCNLSCSTAMRSGASLVAPLNPYSLNRPAKRSIASLSKPTRRTFQPRVHGRWTPDQPSRIAGHHWVRGSAEARMRVNADLFDYHQWHPGNLRGCRFFERYGFAVTVSLDGVGEAPWCAPSPAWTNSKQNGARHLCTDLAQSAATVWTSTRDGSPPVSP